MKEELNDILTALEGLANRLEALDHHATWKYGLGASRDLDAIRANLAKVTQGIDAFFWNY